MKKGPKTFSQEQLRELTWKVGAKYPIPFSTDNICLLMVTPAVGFLQWNLLQSTMDTLQIKDKARLIVRIYDATDIYFDGVNAHGFMDIDISAISGDCYFNVKQVGRCYLAEIGFRLTDGSFQKIARSNAMFFDRDRPSGIYETVGLFACPALDRGFPVENVFDARFYEKIGQALLNIRQKGRLCAGIIYVNPNLNHEAPDPIEAFILKFCERLCEMGDDARLFAMRNGQGLTIDKAASIVKTIDMLSKEIVKQSVASQKEHPLQLVHCYDWYSASAGQTIADKFQIPMVLTLHCPEFERARTGKPSQLSSTILRREMKAVTAADLVIVPRESTRVQIIEQYGALAEKIVVLPFDLTETLDSPMANPSEIKRWFSLNPDAPVVLFANEVSHAAGADLLVDALPTICRNNGLAQFVFAGAGPLKNELESRTRNSGIGHRCRFVGDLGSNTFEKLLAASDFVVIPARTWQDEALAQMAIGFGIPVLTTHQAGLKCVIHGRNGLVTFDNPGSITWGIQELLANPMQGNIVRLVAQIRATQSSTLEKVIIQHYAHYQQAIKRATSRFQGADNA